MAALAMTGNALDELERARLVHLIGVERTEALWPPDPTRPLDPAAGLDLAGIDLGALGQAYGDVSYRRDRKSTRLNSSHSQISYAVFCLENKNSNESLPRGANRRAPTTPNITL